MIALALYFIDCNRSLSRMVLRRIEKMSFVGARVLSAKQILGLHKAPLYSVDGFGLFDGFLDVVGLVLAPGGDPSKVGVDVDPGVEFQWHYPLPNPGAFEYYWYWPQSDQSPYRL